MPLRTGKLRAKVSLPGRAIAGATGAQQNVVHAHRIGVRAHRTSLKCIYVAFF